MAYPSHPTFVRFQFFSSLEAAKSFGVVDAIPEREDGMLGQLPDGTPVWAKYEDDPASGRVWTVADL